VNSEHYEVAVVDEHDNALPPGEVGECVSRCRLPYTQMSEYYKMPQETLKAFRNRWLHSGDMCRIDADGWLYFVGRGKDTIRRRGENISCYELESILQGYDAIEECASIPVPSELGEDEIKVVIAPRAGRSLGFDEVMAFCRDHMPKFMVPRYIEFVAEVPKLPNHKIDKTALKKAGLNSSTWDAETGTFLK
jgi:crotonobetaine/carnitine-CoA ligase